MTEELVPTFFSVAVDALRTSIKRSGCGYGRDEETLGILLEDPGILEASFTQSVQELVRTAIRGKMDEETRTASFMGHLASNLNWYGLLARWTEQMFPYSPPIRRCDLFWAQQSKNVEAWRGADFGIAVREKDDLVRVALYQAKRCKSGEMASLLRRVKDRNKADRLLLEDYYKDGLAMAIADARSDHMPSLHQVHRLEVWRRRGIEIIRKLHGKEPTNQSWCRYVFWFDAPDSPLERELACPTERHNKECFDDIRNGLRLKNENISFDIDPIGMDFGLSVCRGGGGSLVIPARSAERLLGNMSELGLPDFIAIDGSGSGGGTGFWQNIFSLSGKEITQVAGSDLADEVPSLDPSLSPAPEKPTSSFKP